MKKKYNKYILFIFIVILLLLVFVPILINGLMFKQGLIKIHGGEEIWISSLSSYFGAIIGGVVSGILTLLGVQLTIDKSSNDVKATLEKQEYERQEDLKRMAIKEQLMNLYQPLYAISNKYHFKYAAHNFTDLNDKERIDFIDILNENDIYAEEDLYICIIEFGFSYQSSDLNIANEQYHQINFLVSNSVEEMKEYLMLPTQRLLNL